MSTVTSVFKDGNFIEISDGVVLTSIVYPGEFQEPLSSDVKFSGMTIKGLKDMADDLGIDLPNGAKKQDIIDILSKNGSVETTVESDVPTQDVVSSDTTDTLATPPQA